MTEPISKYVFPFVQPLMVRVLAAGKPGTIAFIGATRFAPGQWFGVILDAPDGAIMGKCSKGPDNSNCIKFNDVHVDSGEIL